VEALRGKERQRHRFRRNCRDPTLVMVADVIPVSLAERCEV
jgi:hypothetical protein